MRSPIQRTRSCKFCTDFKGQPKVIMPEHLYLAKRMSTGDYKCHICQEADIQKMIAESKKRRGISS